MKRRAAESDGDQRIIIRLLSQVIFESRDTLGRLSRLGRRASGGEMVKKSNTGLQSKPSEPSGVTAVNLRYPIPNTQYLIPIIMVTDGLVKPAVGAQSPAKGRV